MTEIRQNFAYPQQLQNAQMAQPHVVVGLPTNASNPQRTLGDEFVHQHKKNGLIERLYNGIKNLTGLGVGSKTAQKAVEKAEAGEITEDEARNTIDKYRKSQVNSAQAFGDVMSVGASGLTFFGLRNWFKMRNAEVRLNEKFYDSIVSEIGELGTETKKSKTIWEKMAESVLKTAKSSKKLVAIAASAAALTGGIVKYGTLKLNRIGSDEFDSDKKVFNGAKTPADNSAYKLDKKQKSRAASSASFKNFLSGCINGALMPLSLVGGAIVGIPAYFAANSLNRYFVGNHEEKNKSLKGYVENLKSDGITQAAIATAAAVPMLKKVNYTNVFDKNLKSATDKLLNANMKPSGFEGKTTYQELEKILLYSKDISTILSGKNPKTGEYLSEFRMDSETVLQEKIKALSEENIFALKFIQIRDNTDDLAKALKENCPPTRTLEQAKEMIKNALGDGYEVKKLLGVGTVAETYLAKTAEGKEVCLKVLKEGINKEKIELDRKKFVDIINQLDKSKEEKEYLIKNVDDLAEGVKKEVDFVNEKEAAEKLVPFTKTAKVVKPIEVKNGVYVMEKAEGISLKSLMDLNSEIRMQKDFESTIARLEKGQLHKWEEDSIIRIGKTKEEYIQDKLVREKESLKHINEKIDRIKERTPDFKDIDLNQENITYLFEEYMKVLTEQFYKIDKNGKILHADIHPGNIFIDVNALKAKKGKVFTLIDTGNTVEMSKEQAMNYLNLTSYINRGNVPDITSYVLKGATLPKGMTEEKATELVSKDLKKLFFDVNTELKPVNNSDILAISSNIMKKHGIIPSSSQLNLDKARTSADGSMKELMNAWFERADEKITDKESLAGKTGAVMGMLKDLLILERKYAKMKSKQEKLNLLQFSPQEVRRYKKNPNMLETNNEDYLVYKLKQKIKKAPKKEDFEKL